MHAFMKGNTLSREWWNVLLFFSGFDVLFFCFCCCCCCRRRRRHHPFSPAFALCMLLNNTPYITNVVLKLYLKYYAWTKLVSLLPVWIWSFFFNPYIHTGSENRTNDSQNQPIFVLIKGPFFSPERCNYIRMWE